MRGAPWAPPCGRPTAPAAPPLRRRVSLGTLAVQAIVNKRGARREARGRHTRRAPPPHFRVTPTFRLPTHAPATDPPQPAGPDGIVGIIPGDNAQKHSSRWVTMPRLGLFCVFLCVEAHATCGAPLGSGPPLPPALPPARRLLELCRECHEDGMVLACSLPSADMVLVPRLPATAEQVGPAGAQAGAGWAAGLLQGGGGL